MMFKRIIERLDSDLRSQKPKASAEQSADQFDAIQLEPRILYSAVPMIDVADATSGAEHSEELHEGDATLLENVSPQSDPETAIGAAVEDEQQPFLSDAFTPLRNLQREIVFVDAGVEDSEQLLIDLWNDDDPNRQIDVVLLSADRDGIEQITVYLANQSDVDAIHILSHGAEGEVRLGNSVLSNQTLESYAGDLAQWAGALDTDADILFYGCDLAGGDGREFVDAVAALCDCDVAASDDVTGHQDLGGDWILEYAVGDVTTNVAFSYAAQASWQGTLDITSNLVAHYEFEENGGATATDSTVNNNDGTWSNAPSWSSDSAVGSYSLDFTGDAVNANEVVIVADDASLDFSGDFSVAFWYNSSVTQSGSTRIIGSHDGSDGFSIFADSNGTLNFFAQGSTSSTTQTQTGGFMNDGTWHHVVAVKSADSLRLYVDEHTSGLAATTFGTIDPAAPLTLGGESATVSDFEGKLDDVRVYTRALSASDIGELYDLGAARTTYSASNGADNSHEHISNVTFVGINNSTGAVAGGYGDYTGQSASITAGSTNTLSVTISPDFQDYVTAWVDWNQDFDFNDAGEEFIVATNTSSAGPHTVNIVAPNDAVIGDTRMRVSLVYSDTPTNFGTFAYGEVEDYTITVAAPEITVDTTNDTVDGTTTDVATLLANKGADGFVSLREAILAVNNDSGTNWTIDVGAGTYNITAGTDDQTGDFDIRNDVTIRGAGIGTTVIDANSVNRLFEVVGSTVTFADMTVTRGGGTQSGGALEVDATSDVTIENVLFDSNDAGGGANVGGAINNSGVLTVNNSQFTNNSSAGDGGAIFSDGTLTVVGTTFDGNTAGDDGGAILNQAGGSATIENSLFVSNAAIGDDGGAIQTWAGLTVTNTTFSNNSSAAASNGGAIFIQQNTTTLQNVTITNHTGYTSGAVYLNTGSLNLRNTIVAGNTGSSTSDVHNASGTINDLGNNLIGDGTGQSALVDGVNGSQVGTSGSPLDPLLGVLADNGGQTATHALLAGSTAIDAGNNTGAPATDQRGTSRDASTDIGAYEFVASGPTTFTVTNTNDSGAGSLREAIEQANANVGADTIEFDITGSGTQVITLASALDAITEQVTIDGTTQAGWIAQSFMPIVIDAEGFGKGLELGATADGSEIRGLVIRDVGTAIEVRSDNNTIAGNWIGQFNSDGSDAGIGEAVTSYGITTWDHAANSTVGGTTAADRNVIVTEGSSSDGIYLYQSDGWNISGNYFGTDTTGNATLASTTNAGKGLITTNDANSLTIGGATDAHRNIFAGLNQGIDLSDLTTSPNYVYNNWFGLGADGTTVLGNVVGLGLFDSHDTQVGGSGGLGNVFVANDWAIGAWNSNEGTVIQGNYIGQNEDGSIVAGNGTGIYVDNVLGTMDVTIGGIAVGEGNVIRGSTGNAIEVEDVDSSVTIRGNSIFDNDGLGIDLNADGVTANDAGDVDTGPSGLQNWAVLTSSSIADNGTFSYSFDTSTLQNRAYYVDFYASTDRDGGQVEGARYLGTWTGITDGSVESGTFSSVTLDPGEFITTITTDVLNAESSEFSNYAVAMDGDGNAAPTDLQVTTTPEGGLSINADAGDDIYLVADQSPFNNNQTEVTIEVEYSATSAATGVTTLFSYADPSSGDEVFFGIEPDGELIFRTSGGTTTAGNSITTAANLFDGQKHTVAVTWENSGGILKFYVDGEELGLGRNSYQDGTTISNSGTVVLGQRQGTPESSFDANDTFSGTLYNVRVFDHVRTDQQLAASYKTELPYDESGMLAQWRFDELSSDGVITESVSGNNLTVKHTDESGFAASEASLTLRVDENALDGTVVGQLYGLDAEREAQIAALLAADADLFYNAETNKFYKASTSNTDWTTAHSAALSTALNSVNGQLVTIRSAAEMEAVDAIVEITGFSYWVGATDSAVDGEFRWYDGNSASDLFWKGDSTGYNVDDSFIDWRTGEPNSGAGREFVQYNGFDNKFDVETSGVISRHIVEWDADDVLDVNQAITYSIESQSVAGAFEIDADTGQIRVADGTLLDADTLATHTVTVRSTDNATPTANTYDESFTISLNNLVEANNAPTGLSSGIELNTDGGNDAYLVSTAVGDVIGGLTETTVEVTFSSDSVPNAETPLFSYASSSIADTILIWVNTSGDLSIRTDTNTFTVPATDMPDLFDGQKHAVAFAWTSNNGVIKAYVDGIQVGSATGYATNGAVSGGSGDGTLVLGNEQDVRDGGFQVANSFAGTFYDVRLWNDVRSEAEIALNYQTKFDTVSLPSGLVANWQMNGFNGSNEVVDVVSGNNLSIGNVGAGGGFTASTPVDDLHISENATDGTSVGFVVPTDPDSPQDIVSDGRFTEAVIGGSFSSYTATTPPTAPTTFGGWTVTNNTAVVHNDDTIWGPSPLGGRSVELGQTDAPASIEQTMATNVGQTYQVTFALTADFTAGESVKDLRVSAAGESSDFSIVQPNNWTEPNPVWDFRTIEFVATDTSTTLAFESLDLTGAGHAVIADVQVIEIPAAVRTILNNDPTLSYDAATDKFYKVTGTTEQFNNAQTTAGNTLLNGVAGQLVTINSAYENRGIRDIATVNLNWMNASDATVEGEWRWQEGTADGDQFSSGSTPASGQYSNWESGQPNGGTLENFAYIDIRDGEWGDSTHLSGLGVIIEWDASEVLSNFTFSLTDDGNGNFEIDSNTGEITVAATNTLDYEVAQSHDVDVTVTDAAGNSYTELSMTIAVDNGLDANQTVPEGISAVLNSHSPVIHLRLGEATGPTAVDAAGNNDGTYVGSPGFGQTGSIAGDTDTAVAFGNGDHVEIPHSTDMELDEGTFQIRFKASDLSPLGTFFSKDATGFVDGGHINVGVQNGEINVRLQSDITSYTLSSDSATQPISENEWHHLAVSFGSGGLKLYVDGQLVDSDAYTGGLATSSGGTGNTEALVIGASSSGNTSGTTDSLREYFDGELDEFALLGTQLSDAEILALADTSSVSQQVDEDGTLTFVAGTATEVSVSDSLAGTNSRMRVTLSVNDGVLNLAQTTGLTFIEGATNSGHLVIDGTESDINAALDGMTFTPHADFNGSVSLDMTTALAADVDGRYEFEGNANDTSNGTNNPGTLVGATTTPDATRGGEVLLLDAAGEHVEIAGRFNTPTDATLAAWVNLDAGIADAEIISLGNNLFLNADGIGSDLTLGYYQGSGVWNFVNATGVNLDGQGWNHVAATFDDTNNVVTVFLNGQEVASLSTTDSIDWTDDANTSLVATIGAHANGGTFDFLGRIDDARIYTRALSADEIAALAADQTEPSDSVAITVDPVNDAPSFELPGEAVFTEGDWGYNQNQDMLVLSDGSMIITPYDIAGSDSAILKLNSDGSIDTSFGSSGYADVSSVGYIQAITEQSDGKILVSGNDGSGIFLARYNADGSIDLGFGSGGVATPTGGSFAEANDIAVQSDGSIIVVGEHGDDSVVTRFTSTGTYDTSFGTSGTVLVNLGGTSERLEAVTLLADDTIIAVGETSVVKMNSAGVLDTGFDSDGILNLGDNVYGSTTQADGKFVVTGYDGANLFVTRFNTDGSVDTDFGTAGTATWLGAATTGYDIAQQADGKIVVAGHTNAYPNQWVAVRFNVDGSLDTNFGTNGSWIQTSSTDFSEAYSVAIYNDGTSEKIVIGGYTTREGFESRTWATAVRLNHDGSLDTTLGENTLDGNPTFIEDGTAVVLDADVQIFDAELSEDNDFGGATLTLERNVAANSDDVFSATGDLSFVGGATGNINLTPDGVVGTYSNASGTLVLTFAGGTTNAQVNEVMQSIAYSNSNDAPPSSVQIDWSFNDGNSAREQGGGGDQIATGSTTVDIIDVAEPASLTVPIAQSVDEDTPLTFSAPGNAIVLDSGSDFDPVVTATLSVNDGGLTLATTTGIEFLLGTNNGDASITISGNESDLNAALDGLQYQGGQDFNGSDTLTVTTGTEASTNANLYARYEFNGGLTTDDSGNGYDATTSGDPTPTTDAERGDVMTFDGDDLLSIPNGTAGLGEEVTIAAWVNLDAGQTGNVFLSVGDTFYVVLDPTTTSFGAGVRADGFTTYSFNPGSNRIAGTGWHHVAATLNDATNELHLYLDGELIKTSTWAGIDVDWAASPSQNITIGGQSDGSDAFVGSIDDARVYDRVLTEDEVVAMMGGHGYDTDNVAITVDAVNDAPTFTTLPAQDQAVIDGAVAGASVLTSGDLDGDGDLDLIGATSDGLIKWYANDGDGGFSDGTTIFNTAGYEFTSIATGDLDGDGDLDFAISNNTADNSEDGILIFENQFADSGAVTFTMTSMETTSFGAYEVAIADIDGDTRLDIVASFTDTDEIVLYEQNTAGVFTRSVAGTVAEAKGIDIGDLDGDGSLDIAVASGSSGIYWLENDSAASPTFTVAAASSFLPLDAIDVAIADFDGDTDLDIGYMHGFFGTALGWMENDGAASPTFTSNTISSLGNFSTLGNLIAGDFNGTGGIDLAVAHTSGDAIRIFNNDGSGSFTEGTQTLTPDGVEWVEAADIDGDGDLDFITAQSGDSTFGAIYNQGSGLYATVHANEDTTLTGLQVQIDDVDANGADLEVTVTVNNGTVTIPTGGVTFSTGNSGSTVTFTGTVSEINTALNSFSFDPTADYFGEALLGVSVNDQGNTGSGGANVSAALTLLQIVSDNDAAVVTVNPIDVNFTEQSPVGIDVNATISDVDDTTLTGGTVRVSGNYEVGVDQLQFTDQNGITGSYDNGTGILTLSGSASVADYQTAIRSIVFNNASDNPSTATRTIEWIINDGDSNSVPVTRDITFNSVNDVPVVSNLGGDTLVYTEGDGASVIDQSANAAVTDVDSTDFDTGTLTVSFTAGSDSAEDVLGIVNQGTGSGQIGISGSDVTYEGTVIGTVADGSGGADLVITFDSDATPTAVSALIQAITYENTDTDNPTTGDRTVRYVLTDGDGGTSAHYDTTIDFTATNDAPVNTVPGTQTVDEDTATTISGISITDVDAGSSDVTTRLQVGNGILNVTLSGSATINAGSNSTGDLTILGSAADINATLASLTYTGDSNLNGTNADTLTMTTNDLGNTGTGGAQSDVDTIQINIDAVNDTPDVVGPGSAYTVNEQTNLSIEGTGFSVTDVDAASGTMTATIDVGEGAITVAAGDSGISISSGNGSGSVVLTGTLTQIDNLLTGTSTGTITYNNGSDTPSASTTITVTVNDGGNTGSDPGTTADGSSEEDSASQTINITAENDVPVISNLGGDTLVYTEGDGASVIDQSANAAVTDVDSTDFDTGTLTVSFTAGSDSAEDVLGIINQGTGSGQTGVSGSDVTYEGTIIGTVAGGSGGADLVITFDSDATPTSVSALVQAITYENTDTDNPTTGDRTVRYVLTDGDGGTSANYDTTIDFTAVNDAPVNTVPGTQTVNEDTATTISGISISDVDAGSSNVTTRLQVGNGVLDVTLSGSATISAGSNSTGDLTIQGSAADINATLASLSYTGDSNVNGTNADTLTVTTNDLGNTGTGGAQSDVDTVQINIDAVNDTPDVVGPGAAYTVDEQTNLSIEGTGFSVTDVDAASGTMTATISVGEGAITVAAGDSGISVSSGNGTGSVVLTGTLSQIDNLLTGTGTGTINYNNSSDTPSASTTITVTVNDGGNTGSDPGTTADGSSEEGSASQTINITADNDVPVIANLGGDTLTYSEGDGASVIDQSANAAVTDVDSTDFDTGTLTVSFTAGSDSAEDVLGIINQGTGSGQIGVSGSDVTYEGTIIGTVAGGSGGADLVITFDSDATPTSVSALVQAITYENTDTDNPTTGDRTVRYVLTDGDGGTSANYDTTIDFVVANDAGSISNLDGDSLSYDEGDGAVVVDQSAAALVSDVDSADFDGGNLTVASSTTGDNSEDQLSVRNQGTAAGQIGFDGSNVTYQGALIGTASGGSNGGDLVIALNANADATAVSALTQSITYENSDTSNPTEDNRTLSFTLNDGDGATSASSDVTISVNRVNDAPQNSLQSTQSVAEDGTLVFSTANGNAFSVNDIDSGTSDIRVTFTVTDGVFNLAGTTGLTSVSGDGTTTVTIEGPNSAVFAALNGSSFSPTADFNGTATLTMVSNDLGNTGSGGALSDSDSMTITVNPSNDDPAIANLNGDTLNYQEGDGAVVIEQSGDAIVNDIDSPDFLGGTLTVSFEAGSDNAEDVLSIVDQGVGAGQIGLSGFDITYGGTTIGSLTGGSGGTDLVVTFTGNADATAVSALIQMVTYENTDTDNPTTGNRTVRYVLTDGDGGASGNHDTTVALSATNDNPFTSGSLPSDVTVTEDVSSNVDLSSLNLNDVDANGSTLTVTLNTSFGGNLTASPAAGISIGGSGTTVSLTGSLSDLNGYLDDPTSISYLHPTPHTFGDNADSITIVINDNGNTGTGGGTDQNLGSVNVDITAVNDSPLIGTNTGTTVAEGGTATISNAMLNEADVDDLGAGLTYTITSGPTNGQLELSTNPGSAINDFTQDDIDNNRVVFVHDGTDASADSFDFSLADGGADGSTPATGTFNFIITAVNDAPVLSSVEGAALNYTENAGAIPVTSSITLTDTDDTHIESATVQITGNYNSSEDVLTFANQNGISGSYNSTNGTWTLTGTATRAEYEAALRSITYTNTSENPNTANRTVTFQVNDGTIDSAAITRDILITPTNDAPVVATNGGVTLSEGDTGVLISSLRLETSDIDNNAAELTYTIDAATTNGTLRRSGVTLGVNDTFTQADIDAGLITYDHNDSETSSDSFDFTVDDGNGPGVSGTFSMTVNPVNDNAPVITSDGGLATASVDVVENGVSVTTVTATDGDLPSQSITYSIVGGADSGLFSIDGNGGQLTFNSAPDFEILGDANSDGVYEVVVRSSDGTLVDDQAISVRITNANEQPTDISPDTISVDENIDTSGGYVIGTLAGTDVDVGDTHSFSVIGGADAGVFSITGANADQLSIDDGVLDFETKPTYQVTIRVTDAGGLFYDENLTLTVNDGNDRPVAVDDTASVNEDTSVSGAVLGNDIDVDPLDTLAATLASTTTNGSLIFNPDGTYTYTPDANFFGTDEFTYQADDGTNLSNVATVAITVNPVNDAPVAIDGSYTTNFNTTLVVSGAAGLTSNDLDIDGDLLTTNLISGPSTGTLSLNSDGTFTFTPQNGFSGTVTFSYAANDGTTNSNVATVTITVNTGTVIDTDPEDPDDGSDTEDDNTEAELDDTTGDDTGGNETNESEDSEEPLASTPEPAPTSGPIVSQDVDQQAFGPAPEKEDGQTGVADESPATLLSKIANIDQKAVRNQLRLGSIDSQLSSYESFQYDLNTIQYALDEMQLQRRQGDEYLHVISGSVSYVAIGATVGAAMWMMSSSALAALLTSALPAAASFDPIFILRHGKASTSDEDLSIAELLEQQNQDEDNDERIRHEDQ